VHCCSTDLGLGIKKVGEVKFHPKTGHEVSEGEPLC
jgi:hypothetical protein